MNNGSITTISKQQLHIYPQFGSVVKSVVTLPHSPGIPSSIIVINVPVMQSGGAGGGLATPVAAGWTNG